MINILISINIICINKVFWTLYPTFRTFFRFFVLHSHEKRCVFSKYITNFCNGNFHLIYHKNHLYLTPETGTGLDPKSDPKKAIILTFCHIWFFQQKFRIRKYVLIVIIRLVPLIKDNNTICYWEHRKKGLTRNRPLEKQKLICYWEKKKGTLQKVVDIFFINAIWYAKCQKYDMLLRINILVLSKVNVPLTWEYLEKKTRGLNMTFQSLRPVSLKRTT